MYAVPTAVLLHICDRQLAPAVARNRCWGLSEPELASESRSRPLTIHIDLLLVAIACTSFLPLAFACHHPRQFLSVLRFLQLKKEKWSKVESDYSFWPEINVGKLLGCLIFVSFSNCRRNVLVIGA